MASTQIQRQQVINVKIIFCKLLYIHKRGSKYMYDVEESLNLPDPNSFQVTHAHKRVSDKHSERFLSQFKWTQICYTHIRILLITATIIQKKEETTNISLPIQIQILD